MSSIIIGFNIFGRWTGDKLLYKTMMNEFNKVNNMYVYAPWQQHIDCRISTGLAECQYKASWSILLPLK